MDRLGHGVEHDTLNAVVTLRNEISPWLMILQVVPEGWPVPSFVPGQYSTLGLLGSAPRCSQAEPESVSAAPDKLIRRAYCIASSAVNRQFLEFYIHLVPSGVLTPRLFNLNIGDRVWLSSKVTGAFTFEHVPEDANVVLIAAGTGLAPYLSMLSTDLAFETERRVALLHGVRHSWDLGYRSILMAMEQLRSHFNYLPIISRPQHEPVPWNGAVGHVQDLWQSDAIEKLWSFRPGPENTHVFLCGGPDMIEDMIALLVEDGFAEHSENAPWQIHAERYWLKSGGDRTAAHPAVSGKPALRV